MELKVLELKDKNPVDDQINATWGWSRLNWSTGHFPKHEVEMFFGEIWNFVY